MKNETVAFVKTLKHLCTLMQDMHELETKKRSALLKQDLTETEVVFKSQQAMIMKLNNAENKRIEQQKLAGFGELTASQILEQASAEEKDVFAPIFEKLNSSAQMIKELNKISLNIVNTELKILKGTQNKSSSTYTASGKPSSGAYTRATFREKF